MNAADVQQILIYRLDFTSDDTNLLYNKCHIYIYIYNVIIKHQLYF